MRYRKLSASGDYVFGHGTGEFFVNDVEGVAQAVRTRLLLIAGEWFLDQTEGTPYNTEILGFGTMGQYDQAFQARILDTPGVTSIAEYVSFLDTTTRGLNVNCTIDTLYGPFVLTIGLGNSGLDVNVITG